MTGCSLLASCPDAPTDPLGPPLCTRHVKVAVSIGVLWSELSAPPAYYDGKTWQLPTARLIDFSSGASLAEADALAALVIRDGGIQEPIEVMLYFDGERDSWTVRDGNTRIAVADRLGIPFVRARFV